MQYILPGRKKNEKYVRRSRKIKMQLIDKIEYYMQYPYDIGGLKKIFRRTELEILITTQNFENIRQAAKWRDTEKIEDMDEDKLAERIFWSREQEKEISFRLKKQIIDQVDILLSESRIEAWMEIFTWYQFLKGKNIIINRFWEFPILDTMLKGFMEELKLFYEDQSPISVLLIHRMKELTDTYFYVIFMLRRIEYDIEPPYKIIHNLMEREISLAIIRTILKDAKIYDKEKVEKSIEYWAGNKNG